MLLTVTDSEGNVVRRLGGPVSAGFHRVAWDLRYPPSDPTDLKTSEPLPWSQPAMGPLAAPGTYTVTLAKRVDGKVTPVSAPQTFAAQTLGLAGLPELDRAGLLAFQQQVARLQRPCWGRSRR